MDVSLEAIDALNRSDAEQRVFDSIKTSFHSLLDPETAVQKIVDDVQLICDETVSQSNLSGTFFAIWWIVVDVVYLLPPDHPWQDIIVGVVKTLRARDGKVKSDCTCLWKDLPGLSMHLLEQWHSCYTFMLADETHSDTKPSQKEMDQWINLNSFTARLTCEDFAPWLNFPIWELATALEDPPLKGATMNCRLRVASEWMLRCGDVILQHMSLDAEFFSSPKTGPLCLDTPALSMKRWGFWKRRFLEISANRKTLELDDEISGRIVDAVYSMTIAEEKNGH